MNAIILNSGIGNRMLPFTNESPKCMVKINGQTILEHEVENLLHYGIKNLIITVGPFAAKIKKLIRNKFPELAVAYVKNPKYKYTNYIYSIWLARDLVDDDTLLLHGDMVFDKSLLGKLLNKKYSCVLVNNKINPPEKDFKGEIVNGAVKKIGVNVFGKNAHFLAPIYKLSKQDFKLWLHEIGEFVKNGEVKVYAENAFNKISNKINLHPVYFSNEFCMEIDNFNDLKIAKRHFSNH
ncbi:MAG: sugar phosphate nucleotidyltransferase [Nanoarchaeota archaeon]